MPNDRSDPVVAVSRPIPGIRVKRLHEAVSEPETATSALSPSRSVAFDLLRSVLRRRKSFEDARVVHDGFRRLPARDRNFAGLIAITALRRLGQIDAVLSRYLNSPLPQSAGAVRDILRLGVAEILFLDIAPHATVNNAVGQTASRQRERFRALVNAVLRRISRDGKAALDGIDETLNIPAWMLQNWQQAYGDAVTHRIATALLREAPLDISFKGDGSSLAQKLDATLLPTGSLRRRPGGLVQELPGYFDGNWWIQDAAAALPARLLGDVRGQRVLDLCAAPGGKTAQLLACGAQVTAVDRSRARVSRLRSNLARLRMDADIQVADATTWQPAARFDAILVDPPCTSTGTIRRHPDILHLKSPDDLPKLISLQDRLLGHAARLVRDGGRIVFCTCSLMPEEGEHRIEALLASNPGLRREPILPGEIGGLDSAITSSGDLRTMPFHLEDSGGVDGFFAARLIKTGPN